MDEKTLQAISSIQRALGLIEGVSCGVEDGCAIALAEAVQMIDAALEVIVK